MEWLPQNWIWLVLAVAAVWLFSRARHGSAMGGCCHGMAHEGPQEASKAQDPEIPPKEAGNKSAPGAASSHRHRGGCC